MVTIAVTLDGYQAPGWQKTKLHHLQVFIFLHHRAITLLSFRSKNLKSCHHQPQLLCQKKRSVPRHALITQPTYYLSANNKSTCGLMPCSRNATLRPLSSTSAGQNQAPSWQKLQLNPPQMFILLHHRAILPSFFHKIPRTHSLIIKIIELNS